MKRWLPLLVLVACGIAAVVAVERQHITTAASPQALLTATADTELEITRIPAHFDHLSDSDEIAVGNNLAAAEASSFNTAAASPDIARYINTVGQRVATHARRRLPWTFHYIPDPHFINAFALPGGQVFIGQGLLALMQSEDALAAVLGHEIEHIDLRHCAERVQTEAHLRHLGALGDLASLPVEVFLAGYTKEQELEADRDGTTLAVQSHYSPRGILELFTAFEKLEPTQQTRHTSPLDEAASLPLATLSGYFRSHPPSPERAEAIRAQMAAQHWPSPPLTPLRKLPF